MSVLGNLLGFSAPGEGGHKKLLGCGILDLQGGGGGGGEGISTQTDTMLSNELNFSVAVHIYKIHVFDKAFPLNISSSLSECL